MVIIMEPGAAPEQVEAVLEVVQGEGLTPFPSSGVQRTVIGVVGAIDSQKLDLVSRFGSLPGVERVQLISEPYKLSSRSYRSENTVVEVGGVKIGGPEVVIIAGPCSVESRDQILATAQAVKASGAKLLRGGAYKPRTSPYSFQGLGEPGLKLLAEAREATGLPVVTEVLDAHDIPLISKYSDVLQVGARNMQNYALLARLGKLRKPVLLKRGPAARLREMLQAAEYIMCGGNDSVILCERGITTFEDATRNTTDINAIPVLKHWSHLPVILDPSHSTGHSRYVAPVAAAGIAAGADGLVVEVHPDPAQALSDGAQALTFERFQQMMETVKRVAWAVGREVGAK